MTEPKYYIVRTCKICSHQDKFELTKRQRAFGLYDFNKIWSFACSKCGATECEFSSGDSIELDNALLLEWGNNSSLSLMPQDEELLLADEKYVDLILALLDNEIILPNKRKVLIEALCIIIYDNIVDSKELVSWMQINTHLLDKVTNELKKRKYLLEEARDWIMDYIKEISYPHIGLEK